MLALDFAIFGNGHGMAMPYFDGRLYWLVDTASRERSGRNGAFYTFMHGWGAQLHSYQWTHPRAGETRRLIGRDFTVLHSRRKFCRVEVAWSMRRLPSDVDEANAAIRQLSHDLNSTLMEPRP